MGRGLEHRRRQLAETALDIGGVGSCLHRRDIDERTGFLRVEAQQDRHLVVSAGTESVVRRVGQRIGLDHRMVHFAGAAFEQIGGGAK